MASFFRVPPGCWVIVVVLVAWAPFAVARPAAAEPPTKLQQQVLKSSVWVFLPKGPPKGGKWEFEAATGFVVDVKRRLVLTSSHVVKTNTKATVFFPQYADDKLVTERMTYLSCAAAGEGITAEVVATNAKTDLALIRLESIPEAVAALTFARKGATAKSRIHSLGNPTVSKDLWHFATWKVLGVSFLRVQTREGNLETLFVYTHPFEKPSEQFGPGASGGPVFNDKGAIVGITQGMITVSGKNCGSFIDVSVIKGFMKKNQKLKEK